MNPSLQPPKEFPSWLTRSSKLAKSLSLLTLRLPAGLSAMHGHAITSVLALPSSALGGRTWTRAAASPTRMLTKKKLTDPETSPRV
tara:strand:+ start:458 stop:715 length:258 start_codon:yes stop_codon:yes gene_type:complete